MDGVGNESSRVLVLGATNLPWGIDAAIRRRFEKRIYIPLPDEEARFYLVKKELSKIQTSVSEPEMKNLGHLSDGYSGADISLMLRDAIY